MTAEQIRKTESFGAEQYFWREIAAQLAELNQQIRDLKQWGDKCGLGAKLVAALDRAARGVFG